MPSARRSGPVGRPALEWLATVQITLSEQCGGHPLHGKRVFATRLPLTERSRHQGHDVETPVGRRFAPGLEFARVAGGVLSLGSRLGPTGLLSSRPEVIKTGAMAPMIDQKIKNRRAAHMACEPLASVRD